MSAIDSAYHVCLRHSRVLGKEWVILLCEFTSIVSNRRAVVVVACPRVRLGTAHLSAQMLTTAHHPSGKFRNRQHVMLGILKTAPRDTRITCTCQSTGGMLNAIKSITISLPSIVGSIGGLRILCPSAYPFPSYAPDGLHKLSEQVGTRKWYCLLDTLFTGLRADVELPDQGRRNTKERHDLRWAGKFRGYEN
jgi:hypothetical protein